MNTQNLQSARFTILILTFIAFTFQTIKADTLNDFICILILTLSNIITLYYCINKKIFFIYPISLITIFFSHFINSGGALYLKSLEFSLVTDNLEFPLPTIFLLSLFNLFIIICHIIYRQSLTTNRIKKSISSFLLRHRLIEMKSINFLYFLGIVGITSNIFYRDLNITLAQQFSPEGPSFFKDIMIGFNIFIYAPVIILFADKLYNIKPDNKIKWVFVLYIFCLIFISLIQNHRAILYDVFIIIGVIYFILFLFGKIEQNKAFTIKLIIFLMLSVPVFNFVENASQTYLVVRGTKGVQQTTPIEMAKLFIKNLYSGIDKKAYAEGQGRRTKFDITEDYYKSSIFNRANTLLINDNFYLVNKELGDFQKKEILDMELKKIIAILPQPIINLFTNNFNKSDYLGISLAYFAYSTIGAASGSLSIGSLFISIYIHTGYWFPLIVLLICLPTFVIFDSFYNYDKKLMILSPVILMLIYQTSVGVVNFFALSEFSKIISFLLRGLPQALILYYLLMKFYIFLTRKT